MLKRNERLCKCGCGEIINLKESSYVIKNNIKRNSYYSNMYHLPKWVLNLKPTDEELEKMGYKKVTSI